jgi:hypothetical protein
MSTLSPLESTSLGRVFKATREQRWCRALNQGERVTLAALHSKGLLARRAWRGHEGSPNAAHEYMVALVVQEEFQRRSVLAATAFESEGPWPRVVQLALEHRPETVTLAYLHSVTPTSHQPLMQQFMHGMRRFLLPEPGPEPAFRWTNSAILLRVFRPEDMRLDGGGAPLEAANP